MTIHINIHMSVRGSAVLHGIDEAADHQLGAKRHASHGHCTSLYRNRAARRRSAGPFAAADRAAAVCGELESAQIIAGIAGFRLGVGHTFGRVVIDLLDLIRIAVGDDPVAQTA